MKTLPRAEYPRPQFVRSAWLNLNGEWDFSFEEETYDKKIIVPFAYQTKASGIDIQDFHDVVYYKRIFVLPEDMNGKKIILHFGAVDYECKVWVNDCMITEHVGGHTSFSCDITSALKDGENTVKVRACDNSFDLEIPRGKQYWEKRSEGIFYTRTTGIWQTVWIEAVDYDYIQNVMITPDLDDKSVEFAYEIEGQSQIDFRIRISIFDTLLCDYTINNCDKKSKVKIALNQQKIKKWNFQEDLTWSPWCPRLFNVEFELIRKGSTCDNVISYFGMRKVSIENGKFMLNNRTFYQKLILDQGYWEESLLTAPSDEAFITDIKLTKEMGFNGVRKHQKVEDPRFLYHADKMGLLVWEEMPSAYVYSNKYVKNATTEWMDVILRDYNHPCIIAWTPLNESWGIPNVKDNKNEQNHSAAMVYLTKSLDSTRPVISNDGWEHTVTDLLTVHDYEPRKEVLLERYKSSQTLFNSLPAWRPLFADGWNYSGQPILVTEFGGISFRKNNWEGWGYSNATSDEDFAARYHAVVSALLESTLIQGFCYTQLTDVEQEINGLLTYDRKPKIATEIIKNINDNMWKKLSE